MADGPRSPGGAALAGLVALGDSITNGRGEPMLGVHAQSWSQWLAEALEMPFTKLAGDGARAPDVLGDQVPRLRGAYAVGCLYVGVNDARSTDWSAAAYEADLRRIAGALAARCERVLLCTVPHDLGRPRAAPKPAQAGAIIRRVAHDVGATVVDLDDLHGSRLVLPDAVHPTALGQVEIAERAAAALRAAGVEVPGSPRSLADPDPSPRAAARWGARYGALLARDLWRRAVEGLRNRRNP
jgi:lysophospholipase L1-like esterase